MKKKYNYYERKGLEIADKLSSISMIALFICFLGLVIYNFLLR